MASGSGLLLLQFYGYFTYALFNPFTGEFQLVPIPLHDGPIGLAVISSTDQSCSARLVAVQVKRHHTIREKKVFKFTTYSTSSRMWEEAETHEEDLVCKSGESVSTNTLPVFVGNSLHWLIEDGSILAFDLEKRRARIIKGPVVKTVGMRFEYDVWFGGVRDSLVFVYFSRYKIVIYVYDCEKTKWQIQHIVDNCIGRTVENDFRSGIPMLFNGEQLFFLLRKSAIMERVIYMHDISTKSWEEIGKMPATTDAIQRYIPFFPTLVKLNSGFYQNDSTLRPDIRGCFHGLHQLFKATM